MQTCRIAVIPGDGIGKEVVPEGIRRPGKHLTSATKSNGISITMPYWDERVKTMAANYPEVKTGQ